MEFPVASSPIAQLTQRNCGIPQILRKTSRLLSQTEPFRNATASDCLYLPFCEYPAPQTELEGDRLESHRRRPCFLAATANPLLLAPASRVVRQNFVAFHPEH